MAGYKVCVSTRTVADVDVFPDGALNKFKVSFTKVYFADSCDYCKTMIDDLGYLYCNDIEKVNDILLCFGLLWEDSLSWDDALEVLSMDYERRLASLQNKF